MTSPQSNIQYPDALMASDDNIEKLAQLIVDSTQIAAFTGAGISTESGIPDYRGPNGVWARNAIPHVDTDSRQAMWKFRQEHYPEMMDKQPNNGHLAITELSRMGKLLAVITQNIDGLHQKAGSDTERVIELHGSTHRLRCVNCGQVYEGAAIQMRMEAGEADPHCEVCGGALRTATILFGESLPQDALQTAIAVAQASDLMLVVGSSLAVNPAARLPGIAKDNGAKIAIVNREPTPLDTIADIRIGADAGSTLSRAVARAKERMETRPA